jgi:FKBP-type peptidyl-prolyl cis-trans isomerase
MNYTGKFIDAAHENLTFETGSNYPFMPGYTSVMPGWTEGVLLMRQGDRVELIIPSYLAYGPTGYASYVAPDTPIRFEMEILSVN